MIQTWIRMLAVMLSEAEDGEKGVHDARFLSFFDMVYLQ